MKKILIYLLLGLAAMLAVLYALGWYDLIENDMMSGDILTDLGKSFRDYPGVIYYFRYIILFGSIIFALIIYLIKAGIAKAKG